MYKKIGHFMMKKALRVNLFFISYLIFEISAIYISFFIKKSTKHPKNIHKYIFMYIFF